MRVVYITRGHGDYLIDFLNAIVDTVDVHIILAKSDEWVAEHLDRRINTFFSKAPRVRNLGNIPALVRTMRYIRKVSPDVVHVQSGTIWEFGFKLLFREIPFVMTIHDVTRHPTRQRWIETPQFFLDRAAKLSDAIIVHGERLKEVAQPRFGNNIRIFASCHGIVSKYGTGVADAIPKRFNVLLFGRIDLYKGVEYLVQAERLIREQIPEINIIIAGEAQDTEYYEQLVEDDQHIDLRLRRQDDDEVHDLYSEADVIALPYTEASQSGVLQIGFAFGLPPVVTSVGGLPDVITDEENGLVVPPRDPMELGKAIIRLLTDLELRRKIIDGVIESRDGPHNWGVITNDVRGLYRELAVDL